MSETQTETPPKAPKAKADAPEFVFVLNTRTSLFALRWYEKDNRPGADKYPPAESKLLGPGLNYVAQSIADASTAKGEEFGAHTGGVLSIVRPLELSPFVAQDMIARTTSRQALIEWHRIEKRDAIKTAIKARLDKPKTKAETD